MTQEGSGPVVAVDVEQPATTTTDVPTHAPTDAPTRWTQGQDELLKSWHRHSAAAQHAHYLLASRLRTANLWIGIPAVVASAVVGTSLFATLADTNGTLVDSTGLRIFIGSLSVVAAVLAAVQTFLGFAKRAEQHVQAADWYAAIRRKIEQTVTFRPDDRGDPKKVLDEIRSDMNKASQTYPEIGEDVWHSVARRYGVRQPAYPEEPPRRTSRAHPDDATRA
jgi:hypothetical protein